ncbi:hypothetical protein CO038_02675 [Candidatus Pacearchaeota archaeon CG_4_9_14_0_2_um_filter_39_13]|nr:hypothetical protein [Candidatus Pacearchaeota archaeon]OIO44426.1 MAG: hypothetical protein AUJ64_00085 [Candidatus Pacearchaeota archaeon CG1_02_39_14]PJC44650.1 MAG: hypothetical protein CO038_02675 [Candidatus Pacearchaeota archaeon CG_4_9_14_0_2_um_filter_39_13]
MVKTRIVVAIGGETIYEGPGSNIDWTEKIPQEHAGADRYELTEISYFGDRLQFSRANIVKDDKGYQHQDHRWFTIKGSELTQLEDLIKDSAGR